MYRNILMRIRQLETPFYIYDRERVEKNAETLIHNFYSCDAKIFFAVKANTSVSILNIICRKRIGAEVVSPGEIFVCLKAGFNPRDILYNNIARKDDEIIYAIKKGVIFFNFEAIDQALALEACARKLNKNIKIFARINPGIFPDTHPHLSTGAPSSKFGMEVGELKAIPRLIKRLKYADFVGLHSHIGSQILSPSPFVKGAKKVIEILEYFRCKNIKIQYVNLGGGFGIPYHPSERELNFGSIAKAYSIIAKKYNIKILLEPGRFIIGNAGYIVTKVISAKRRKKLPLYIIDAGITENPRPALYGAYHHIEPVFKKSGRSERARIAGPLCENSDEFGMYNLPKLKIGDVLMIHDCGAYTRTMASNYNGRLLPAEYIFNKSRLKNIRKKQIFRNLVSNEEY